MRIGIMLRALDEKGGVGVYTRYLTQKLLELDRRNHYVLLYSNPAHVGRFAHHANVTERVVYAPNKAFWDQVAVPYITWKSRLKHASSSQIHRSFARPLQDCHGVAWRRLVYSRT